MSDGRYGIVIEVEAHHLSDPEATYNFEVEDYHTYYVGEQGILVHNTCPKIAGQDVYRGGDFSSDLVKGHYKVDSNGNVLPTRGPSVNTVASEIPARLKISKITSLPDGLIYKQVGSSLSHFEVIPATIMPEQEYLKLLLQIRLSPI